jgi:beta-phosphoglucomutase
MLQAVIFDFDGVLADSEPLHMRAWQDVLANVGVDLTEEEYYAHYLGYDDEGLIRMLNEARSLRLGTATQQALLGEKAQVTAELLRQPGVLFPGARQCVERLAAAVPLAIASGALRHEIEMVLEGTGLARWFPVIVASGETPLSKPAPDPYQRAVALLQEAGRLGNGHAAAARCVAIEDSRWGLASARAAGLRTVAVSTSYDASELGAADAVVPDLHHVTVEMLRELVEAAA